MRDVRDEKRLKTSNSGQNTSKNTKITTKYKRGAGVVVLGGGIFLAWGK